MSALADDANGERARARSLKASLRLLFLVTSLFAFTGCTHIEYTRSLEGGRALLKPDEFGSPRIDLEDFHVNQISWLDPTGVVCAQVQTTADAYGKAKTARNKAIEHRQHSYTYTYNVYAPLAGMYCGLYYRWGEGQAVARAAPAQNASQTQQDVRTSAELWELGFHVDSTEHVEWTTWLTYNMGAEVAVGRYEWTSASKQIQDQLKRYDDPMLFRTPLWLSLNLSPPMLYGLGAKAQGGADLIAWAFSSGVGRWFQKFDYKLAGFFKLNPIDTFYINVEAGYRAENLHWGEYWLKRTGPYASASLSLVF